jgi:hypothetical protein
MDSSFLLNRLLTEREAIDALRRAVELETSRNLSNEPKLYDRWSFESFSDQKEESNIKEQNSVSSDEMNIRSLKTDSEGLSRQNLPSSICKFDSGKPKIFQIVLSRGQTEKQVQDTLKKATLSLSERTENFTVRVPIQGYEATSVHPALNKQAKNRYAEAIEWGLAGFLMYHGFRDEAREVYCMGYVPAQIRGKRLKFKKIDEKHMAETLFSSYQSFLKLLPSSVYPPVGPSEEEVFDY